jgi:hypothetical protein
MSHGMRNESAIAFKARKEIYDLFRLGDLALVCTGHQRHRFMRDCAVLTAIDQ